MRIYENIRDGSIVLDKGSVRVHIGRVYFVDDEVAGGAWTAVVTAGPEVYVFNQDFSHEETPGCLLYREPVAAFVRLLDRLVEEGHLTHAEADQMALRHPVTWGWTCRRHPRIFLWRDDTGKYCLICRYEGKEEEEEYEEEEEEEFVF